jgi:hypothetical protein
MLARVWECADIEILKACCAIADVNLVPARRRFEDNFRYRDCLTPEHFPGSPQPGTETIHLPESPGLLLAS